MAAEVKTTGEVSYPKSAWHIVALIVLNYISSEESLRQMNFILNDALDVNNYVLLMKPPLPPFPHCDVDFVEENIVVKSSMTFPSASNTAVGGLYGLP